VTEGAEDRGVSALSERCSAAKASGHQRFHALDFIARAISTSLPNGSSPRARPVPVDPSHTQEGFVEAPVGAAALVSARRGRRRTRSWRR
jgi:hypothetical protein